MNELGMQCLGIDVACGPLPSVPLAARLGWLRVLVDAAQPWGAHDGGVALWAARCVEGAAHAARQQRVELQDGSTAMRYGETVLLALEAPQAHLLAAGAEYSRLLTRVVWCLAEHGLEGMLAKAAPLTWLELSDEALLEGTARAAWERDYLAAQALAQTLMQDAKQSVGKGLFPCPRCGSWEVESEERQTRSADEPLTIFNVCNNAACGKRFVIAT